MKIIGIFLNNELRTGGHTRYIELMEGLAARGHEVKVYINEYLKSRPLNFIAIPIPVRYVKGKNFLLGQLFRKSFKGSDLSHLKGVDWIVVFGQTHWPSARLLSRLFGIPVCFAFRSDSIEENRSYLRYEKTPLAARLRMHAENLFERIRETDITARAASIVFQSSSDRDHYCERNPNAKPKSYVIRGDIRQPRFDTAFANKNTSTQCRQLLFVGTLGQRKGLAYLIRAIALLHPEIRNLIHLDILAPGDSAPFVALIASLKLEQLISLHGKVSAPLPFMVAADLLVAPSLFDSYPNVILEALHVGLPVIGSRVGGIPDMLADPSLLFDPASPESLAGIIGTLVSSDAVYLKLSQKCAERRSWFDFDWSAEWEKILADKPADN